MFLWSVLFSHISGRASLQKARRIQNLHVFDGLVCFSIQMASSSSSGGAGGPVAEDSEPVNGTADVEAF